MFNRTNPEDGVKASTTNSAQQDSASKSSARVPTTIGSTLEIRGDVLVTGNQGVHVEGCIEGTITLSDNILSIGRDGRIDAAVHARAIIVAGEVRGDLKGDEQVVINSTGNVRGNILAPRVILKDGCKFNGSIDMDVEPNETRVNKGSKRSEKVLQSKVAGGAGDRSPSPELNAKDSSPNRPADQSDARASRNPM